MKMSGNSYADRRSFLIGLIFLTSSTHVVFGQQTFDDGFYNDDDGSIDTYDDFSGSGDRPTRRTLVEVPVSTSMSTASDENTDLTASVAESKHLEGRMGPTYSVTTIGLIVGCCAIVVVVVVVIAVVIVVAVTRKQRVSSLTRGKNPTTDNRYEGPRTNLNGHQNENEYYTKVRSTNNMTGGDSSSSSTSHSSCHPIYQEI